MKEKQYDVEKLYDDLMDKSASFYWYKGWESFAWLGNLRASFIIN